MTKIQTLVQVNQWIITTKICCNESIFENDVNTLYDENDDDDDDDEKEWDRRLGGLEMQTETAVTVSDDCQGIIPFLSFEFCQQFPLGITMSHRLMSTKTNPHHFCCCCVCDGPCDYCSPGWTP